VKADAQLHRDRLVIDMHWLWCRNASLAGLMPQGIFAHLLDPTVDFDFEAVERYAGQSLASKERSTEHIGISPEVQWQLAAIKSRDQADTHRAIFDGGRDATGRVHSTRSAVMAGIASWALRSPGIRAEKQVYLDLWVARKMLGTKAPAWQIAELGGLMSGTSPLEKSTVRQKLKRLDTNVPAATA
jgi:hypothetical protein